MRRVVNIPVLLVLAAVASSASVATTGVRVQSKDRIISAANLPAAVKRLSTIRNATQPLPSFSVDPTPVITEFYGPAKTVPVSKPKAASPAVGAEAVILRSSRRQSR
jgi:hypothetical protein